MSRYRVVDVGVDGISQELGVLMPSVGTIALTKGIRFDMKGRSRDTLLLCLVTPRDAETAIDAETLRQWLRVRTKIADVKLYIETPADEE